MTWTPSFDGATGVLGLPEADLHPGFTDGIQIVRCRALVRVICRMQVGVGGLHADLVHIADESALDPGRAIKVMRVSGIRVAGTIIMAGVFQMKGKTRSGAITRWPTSRMVK